MAEIPWSDEQQAAVDTLLAEAEDGTTEALTKQRLQAIRAKLAEPPEPAPAEEEAHG